MSALSIMHELNFLLLLKDDAFTTLKVSGIVPVYTFYGPMISDVEGAYGCYGNAPKQKL